MSDDPRRAVLEAIAYGDDATPTERLRALELLREEVATFEYAALVHELVTMSDDELAAELSRLRAVDEAVSSPADFSVQMARYLERRHEQPPGDAQSAQDEPGPAATPEEEGEPAAVEVEAKNTPSPERPEVLTDEVLARQWPNHGSRKRHRGPILRRMT